MSWTEKNGTACLTFMPPEFIPSEARDLVPNGAAHIGASSRRAASRCHLQGVHAVPVAHGRNGLKTGELDHVADDLGGAVADVEPNGVVDRCGFHDLERDLAAVAGNGLSRCVGQMTLFDREPHDHEPLAWHASFMRVTQFGGAKRGLYSFKM